jgi:hypothetical protein
LEETKMYRPYNMNLVALCLWLPSLTLFGCGGGGSNVNTPNLTQPQAQQVGIAVSNDVGLAVASALGNVAVPLDISPRDNMLVALKKNSRANIVSKPEDVTCSGSTCTVSGTYTCPGGGSIAVSGSFSGNNTSASGTLTETPSMCSDGTLVIGGDPDIAVGLQGSDNGVTTTVNLTIGGGVNFSPVQVGQFPTGSCQFSVNASASVNDSTGSVTSSSISGSICGQSISGN